MRVELIGKRQFAFDLRWNDKFGDDAKEAVRDGLDEDARGYYTVAKRHVQRQSAGKGLLKNLRRSSQRDDEPVATPHDAPAHVLGYCEGEVKGKLYSFAEALIKLGRDGIYVIHAGEDRYWYGVIADGQIVAGTDRTLKEFSAYEAVQVLKGTFGLPVYSTCDLIDGSHEFDPVRAVEKVKLTPMRVYGKQENVVVGAVVLLAVVGGIGYGSWHYFVGQKQTDVSQAEVAAQKRAAYLAAAKGALDQVPVEAAWASEAYRASELYFDDAIGGWSLDGVTCLPGACTATYSLPGDSKAYAISPVFARFGREVVVVLDDMRSLKVALNLPAPESSPAADQDVVSPEHTGGRLLDTLGRLGMNFSAVSLDGQVKREQLNVDLQAPPEMPQLIRETVATKDASSLDLVKLRLLSAYMAESGFVATTFTYSTGSGAIAPAWRVEWVRIHGGEV